jgi:copper homeostasis protein
MLTLEICAYSLEDALRAQSAGAHRIELCSDAASGGVTPSAGTISTARELLQIPLFVMIRPRPGNFLYSDPELAAMRRDIELCKSLKVDGIVLGILSSHNEIDRARTAELVHAAHPLEVTFHRAFDLTPDPMRALEDVIAAGCSRLLTSGHRATALEGAAEIAQLVRTSRDRITILPGSGIRSANLSTLADLTHATEFHSSARVPIASASKAGSLSFGESHQLDTAEVQSLRLIADRHTL